MGNTYSQIHIQFVWTVKHRKALIDPSWEVDLYKYIMRVVQDHRHKALQINGMPDHMHLLVGMRVHEGIADLMRDVKANSSRWINQQKKTESKFAWQSGYGAFSYSRWDVPMITNYIKNQKIHHQKITWREEYIEMLHKHEIDYDERYLFDEVYTG